MGHLSHNVRGRGSDQNDVGLLSKRDVMDGVLRIIEQTHRHRLVR